MEKNERSRKIPKEAFGIFLISSSLALFLSEISFTQGNPFSNWLGLIGHLISTSLFFLFGLSAFFLPLFLGLFGVTLFRSKKELLLRHYLLFFLLALFSFSLLFVLIADHLPSLAALFRKWTPFNPYRTYLGGVPLHIWYDDLGLFGLKNLIGEMGTTLLISSLLAISAISFVPRSFFLRIKSLFKKPSAVSADAPPFIPEEPFDEPALLELPPKEPIIEKPEPIKKIDPPKERIKPPINYDLPPATLLTPPQKTDLSHMKGDLKQLAKRLEETLQSFGIEAKVGNIHVGPSITSFEVLPAVGVKVQRICTLEHDIALNLQAKSIRIIAPIPGKAAVGIEVPNKEAQEVSFRELLERYQSESKRLHLPLLLGKGVSGEEIFADLTKMPHLIIAGATGSGKSVSINVIVMSLLMNLSASEVKLLIVDPKKVELGAFSPLPHMIAPVITEPNEAHLALHWLVKEMERRYDLLQKSGLRNIQAYRNEKAKNPEFEDLPYIVVIIDELADLMMMSSMDIETPIIRLAQMARAIGIHLILATQRPSREVLTGLIKANFPARIAFKVASRVNSQIILDDNGAETLLGNGDMLLLAPSAGSLIRAQGAYIRDDDILRVIEHISKLAPPSYLISSFNDLQSLLEEKMEKSSSGNDALFNEAKQLVLEMGVASTTFLQRKLKIGYARAASLMDELEEHGIVGPQEGAKPRKIYFTPKSGGKEF